MPRRSRSRPAGRNVPEDRPLAALAEARAMTRLRFDSIRDRFAVTFVYAAGSDVERIPENPVPIHAARAVALGFRWSADSEGLVRKRMPLATYRLWVDLGEEGGTGRVTLVPETVYDLATYRDDVGGFETPPTGARALFAARSEAAARTALQVFQAADDADPADLRSELTMPPVYWCFNANQPPVFEPTYSPEDWEKYKVVIDGRDAWPAEMFVRPVGSRFETHPVDGSPDPWRADPQTPGDHAGSWCLRDGVAYPDAQTPAQVVVFLAGFRGRSVRNPAYAALRNQGLIDALSYRQWRSDHSRVVNGGVRTYSRPAPGNAAGELRAAIDARVAQSAGAAGVLLGAVRREARFFGVDHDDDTLADLIARPAERATAPHAAAVQVLRLAAPSGPDNLAFRIGSYDLDFADLGEFTDVFRPLGAVEAAEYRYQLERERR